MKAGQLKKGKVLNAGMTDYNIIMLGSIMGCPHQQPKNKFCLLCERNGDKYEAV